jgi:glycosyltransferase involved in cell wall biosynthesis
MPSRSIALPKRRGGPLQILMVTPQPFFEDRGTPIAVAAAAQALTQNGHRVDLLSFPIGRHLSIPGVHFERCGNPLRIRRMPIGFSARKALLDASLLRRFAQLLSRRRYDVVHAVEEAAWFAAMLCPLRGIRFIYDMASAIPEELGAHRLLGRAWPQRVLRGAEREVARRASHIVCSGGLGSRAAELAPGTPVTEWRFPVVESVADLVEVAALRDSLHLPPDARVVLYAGNFSRYQGIDLLFDAFALAAAEDSRLHLVCVGASDDAQAARLADGALARFADRVRIEPRQRRSRMPVWFALADCLVSLRPSGDNVPLKVFEYMASRRPIVATRGAAHEPLIDERRGFLADCTPESIAAALRAVFADPAGARARSDAAADYALRQFSWGRFRRLVEGVYRDPDGPEEAEAGREPALAPRR